MTFSWKQLEVFFLQTKKHHSIVLQWKVELSRKVQSKNSQILSSR